MINELRIGNWVASVMEGYHTDTRQVTIDDLKNMTIDDIGIGYLPIPLTPEILEKVRFAGTIFPAQLSISDSGKYYWGNINVELKYLHQLQNLYFALTGEELEIKL